MVDDDSADLGVTLRGRRAVAASILGVVLIGGYFAASQGQIGALPGEYLINAVVLGLAFWFPALRLGAPRDMLTHWRSLGLWLLAWTLVWDLATAGILGERTLFQEWWLVYPSGVLVLAALLGLHVLVVSRVDARRLDDRR
jgi:hypothetical protein